MFQTSGGSGTSSSLFGGSPAGNSSSLFGAPNTNGPSNTTPNNTASLVPSNGGASVSSLQNVPDVLTEVKQLKAWFSSLSPSVGSDTLDNNIATLANNNAAIEEVLKLLEQPGRSEQHKREIEGLKRDEVDVTEVLRIAEVLDLDDKVALALWQCAGSDDLKAILGPVSSQQDRIELAVKVFFHKRNLVLAIVKQLFWLAQSERNRHAQELCDRLIGQGLLKTLMDTVREHSDKIESFDAHQPRNMPAGGKPAMELAKERRTISECIFIHFLGTHSEDNEVIELIHLVQKLSQKWLRENASLQHAEELYNSLYVLMVSLCAALDLSCDLYDRQAKKMCFRRMGNADKSWLEEIDTALDAGKPSTTIDGQSNWTHDGVHGLCLLFWGTFLGDISPQNMPSCALVSEIERNNRLTSGFDKRGLVFLRGILRSPEFAQDEFRETYLSVIDSFVDKIVTLQGIYANASNFLSHRSHLVEQITHKNSGGKPRSFSAHQAQAQPERIPDADALPDTLEDLLNVLQSINMFDSYYAHKFWDTHSKFLDTVIQKTDISNDPHSLYAVVLSFAASLGGTAKMSQALVYYFAGSDPNFSWSILIGALRKYLDDTTRAQQTAGSQNTAIIIPLADQVILSLWLRVLCAAIHTKEGVENLLRTPEFSGFETGFVHMCFALLASRLEPAFKAQLVQTISKLCVHTGIRKIVLDLLDNSSQSMAPGGAIGASANFPTPLYQIVQGARAQEASDETYPLTASFLELVWTLLTDESPAAEDMLQNSIVFILNEVYLKLDQRHYRDSGEKWHLATSCCRIFVCVLSRYNAASSNFETDLGRNQQRYSGGYLVMMKVLEGGMFFTQLINTLVSAGGVEGVLDRRASTASNIPAKSTSALSQDGAHDFSLYGRAGHSPSQASTRKWFVVCAHRSNIDIRNSSIIQGEPVKPDFGHGLLRVPNNNTTPERPTFDGGRFASWLIQPLLEGWTKCIRSPNAQNDGTAPPQLSYYQWDDGDLGGMRREETVHLTIKLLEEASSREEWFFGEVQRNNHDQSSRIERLYRLFSEKERLYIVAGFLGYEPLNELRLHVTKLIFRLSEQASNGSIVRKLRMKKHNLIRDLAQCLLGPVSNEEPEREMEILEEGNATIHSTQQQVKPSLHKCVLQQLIEGLSHPQGNLSQLLLGFDDVSHGHSRPESINLGPSFENCCVLNIVLDRLDENYNDWISDPEMQEMMYRMVFKLCDNRMTGFAMAQSLHKQRDKFWFRHFDKLISGTARFSLSAKQVESIAWVVSGVGLDMRIALTGEVPIIHPASLLLSLFSENSDRCRILKALEDIPLALPQELADLQSPDLFKQLEVYNQKSHGNSFWTSFVSYGDHSFYKLKLDDIRETFTKRLQLETQQQQYCDFGPVEKWVRDCNAAQEVLAARAHLLYAWTDVVKISMVDSRDILLHVLTNGKNEVTRRNEVYVRFIVTILGHLNRSPKAPASLADPLAALVVSLVAELRFGDERGAADKMEAAISAATGAFSKRLCTPMNAEPRGKSGVACIPREDFRKVLQSLLEALSSKSRSYGIEAASPLMRSSLYSALLALLFGMREAYAQELSVLGQVPVWVSEKEFLARSDSVQVRTDRTPALRDKAVITLETLQFAERGSNLLDMAIPDACEAEDTATRLTALGVLKVLLECDKDNDNRWYSSLKRQRVLRHLLLVTVDRIVADKLISDARVDRIYGLSVTLLTTTARSTTGALYLAESGFLTKLSMSPLLVLCDKRAIDAWVTTIQDDMKSDTAPSQERRHDLVLPLLRLILAVLTTLENSSLPDSSSSSIADFKREVLRFFKTQKRMLSSALAYAPLSLSDMEESILLLSILTRCVKCSTGTLISRELGPGDTVELDAIIFDLIQELCCPQRGEWMDTMKPLTESEVQRSQICVPAPLDLFLGQNRDNQQVSLFQLDIFSQQRRLLQCSIAYCRVRRESFPHDMSEFKAATSAASTHDKHVNTLSLCLDYASKSLAALSRGSQSNFRKAIAEGATWEHDMEDRRATYTESYSYVFWACKVLLFVLEGALTVLYSELKAVRVMEKNTNPDTSNAIRKWLKHTSDRNDNQGKSALEQLEDLVRSNESTSQFIHLILRRMREL
eukprot:CAMPEP_0184545180 /NCGR_PEP_ID=MMETSP0199_2-20130426/4120_1 /TAXON_ID=1112570 /ORGANISM="Thraustochytrium sp., Strain LLF1b" /LENGTH=2115 /DNA_ID=CAMNT_0026939449 /DNA_START=271 /DNA_END=6618 /DNA_ORIENTATION=-